MILEKSMKKRNFLSTARNAIAAVFANKAIPALASPAPATAVRQDDPRWRWNVSGNMSLQDIGAKWPGTIKMAGNLGTNYGTVRDPRIETMPDPIMDTPETTKVHLATRQIDPTYGSYQRHEIRNGSNIIRLNTLNDRASGTYRSMIDTNGIRNYSYVYDRTYWTWFAFRQRTLPVNPLNGWCMTLGTHVFTVGGFPEGSRQPWSVYMMKEGYAFSLSASTVNDPALVKDPAVNSATRAVDYNFDDIPNHQGFFRDSSRDTTNFHYFIMQSKISPTSAGFHRLWRRVGTSGIYNLVASHDGQTVVSGDAQDYIYPRVGMYAPVNLLSPAEYKIDYKGFGIIEDIAGSVELTVESIAAYVDSF